MPADRQVEMLPEQPFIPYESVEEIQNEKEYYEEEVEHWIKLLNSELPGADYEIWHIDGAHANMKDALEEWNQHALLWLGTENQQATAHEYFTTGVGSVNMIDRLEDIYLDCANSIAADEFP